MLKNYIKIAWRSLVRNRAYSLINTLGLSVGMASCLLIFLFIQDELSYDRFHEDADRIYRVTSYYSDGERSAERLATSNLLAPTLKEEIPGIESIMRLSYRWSEVLVEWEENKFYESRFFFVDTTFFDLFSFELMRGNPETALNRPFTVILTEQMALKYFGERDPMGEVLTIQGSWGPDEYEVTGVMENVPHNSHLSINFLTSFETLRFKNPRPAEQFEHWSFIGSYTYAILSQETTPEDLGDDLTNFISRHRGEQVASMMEYRFQPITDIHLYSHFERELEPNSDPRYLYIFGSIALLILVIAGFNYMNLATARSTDRAREVGIRKTLGGDRQSLVLQFLSESLIFCLISMILALLLTNAVLPYFNELTGKPLALELFNPLFLFSLVTLLLIIGLAAGLYPSLVLSRFNPAHVFGGFSGGRKKSILRNMLVVSQFVVSVFLITGTLVISNQMAHIRDLRLGLNDEQVVHFSTGPGTEFRANYNAFKDRLLSYTGVESVTHMTGTIPSLGELGMSLQPEGFSSRISVNDISIGEDFLQTLEIPLASGIDISDLPADAEDSGGEREFTPVMINESAVREWGWEEPIGKTFEGFNPTMQVVGLVEDFHYRSLKEQITPLVLWSSEYSVSDVYVRIKPDNITETMAYIEEAWNEMGPGTPLDYTFLDDRFDSMYQAEDRLASLFGSFTVLAILIACLGLFGLAAYTAERRTKEIGIRKVLGATVANIITLLSKDFVKLVLLGFVIAVPIAWYAMNQWLQDFAYKIEIGPGIFVLAGGVALLIALTTVSWQSVRAALANPVESLRSE